MNQYLKIETYLVFLSLFAVCIIFSLPYSPIYESLRYDREIYQYIGMLMNKGLIPYIDVFDHKPPVIYILNYLGFLISPNSTWGIYIIQNLMAFLSSYLIYKLSKKQLNNTFISLTIAVIYLGLMNSSIVLWGGNHTRQFASFFLVGIIYIVFGTKRTVSKFALLGVLLGLIFFTQQNEILAGAVLISYYLIFKKKFIFFPFHKILNNFFYLSLGLFIPVFFIFSLLLYWNNFDDFISQAFLVNVQDYIQLNSYLNHITNVLHEFSLIVVKHKVLFPLALFSIFYIIIHKLITKNFIIHSKFIVILIAFIFQVLSTSISGNTWGHYFLMFIPITVCLFIFILSLRNLKSVKYLAIVVMLVALGKYTININFQKPDNNLLHQITKEVDSVKNKPGQFYSLHPRYLRVNYNLNITSPSKYAYIPHFYPKTLYNILIDDFIKNNTKYILYELKDNKYPPELKSFIKSNYSEVFSYKDSYQNFSLLKHNYYL